MSKLLLIVLSLGLLGLMTQEADAERIAVKLSKNQVATVCNGKSYCQVSCGQYTCEFGCGSAGCHGQCLTCPTGQKRVGKAAVKGAVRGARWQSLWR
jgi:hypothetical protein